MSSIVRRLSVADIYNIKTEVLRRIGENIRIKIFEDHR